MPFNIFYMRCREVVKIEGRCFACQEINQVCAIHLLNTFKIMIAFVAIRFNKRVQIIQLALATVTDLRGAEPGKWDAATAAACSRFQRNVGRVGSDVTGLPDMSTLQRLSKVTGLFKLED